MTIPVLTPSLSEAARSQTTSGNLRPEYWSDAALQRDGSSGHAREQDFAAMMSDGPQKGEKTVDIRSDNAGTAGEPNREGHADDPNPDRDMATGEDAPDLVAQDAPRRQVTIPELPTRRPTASVGEAPMTETAGQKKSKTTRLVDPAPDTAISAPKIESKTPSALTPSETTPDARVPAVEPARAPHSPAGSPGEVSTGMPDKAVDMSGKAHSLTAMTGETASGGADAVVAGAGRSRTSTDAQVEPRNVDQRAAVQTGQVSPNAPKGQIEPAGLRAETTDIAATEELPAGDADRPRAATTPQTDMRAAAPANTVAAAVRATALPRAAARPDADARVEHRGTEPLSRAAEVIATTPAAAPQVSAAHSAVAAQITVLQPAVRDALAAKDESDSLLALDGEEESLRFDLRGASGSTSSQPASFAAAMTRADLPRSVAMQIADIARAMPDRPVDVSLNPEELGRVRLSISIGDGGVTLNVLAERPETLDLMRRHADQLARDLADLGFASIDLAFGKGHDPEAGDGDGGQPDRNGKPARASDEIDARRSPAPLTNRLTLGPTGGLDIRI